MAPTASTAPRSANVISFSRWTEAFTPLGAGLIMEETRLGLVRKSKITNCATPCNTVASIRSFLRGNEGNEGDWGTLQMRLAGAQSVRADSRNSSTRKEG